MRGGENAVPPLIATTSSLPSWLTSPICTSPVWIWSDEIHDAAVKAAIKDQETAGLDVVSDGELRRDNMIDHFAVRLPGVSIDHASKKYYYDFYDTVVRARMPSGSLGLVAELQPGRQQQLAAGQPGRRVRELRDVHPAHRAVEPRLAGGDLQLQLTQQGPQRVHRCEPTAARSR